MMQGQIAAVHERTLGTELTADVVVGTSVLPVDDPDELDAQGGTLQISGIYALALNIIWEASGSGRREVGIFDETGDRFLAIDVLTTPPPSGRTYQSVTAIAKLAAEDRCSAQVWQNSGGSLEVRAGSSESGVFAMYRIGDG